MSETNKWMRGAIILTITGFISRILGMIYRVPLQNIAGDEGLYVYQQIYLLLSLAIILRCMAYQAAVATAVFRKPTVEATVHPGLLFADRTWDFVMVGNLLICRNVGCC